MTDETTVIVDIPEQYGMRSCHCGTGFKHVRYLVKFDWHECECGGILPWIVGLRTGVFQLNGEQPQ